MSAIVAAHGPFDTDLGLRMLARMQHRGPDGHATREHSSWWLGTQRLAIITPEVDPITEISGNAVTTSLVGDGHIYNHRRVLAELDEGEGSAESAVSDFEAALRLYRLQGNAAFEKLWGAFALVVADTDGDFTVARDALGIAPLYWARHGDTTLFASELKSFEGEWRSRVEPFPPGHLWTPHGGLQEGPGMPGTGPVLLKTRDPREDPPAWVFDALRETLIRAVTENLDAQVPIGVLLSGGVDSSIITAIAAKALRERGVTVPTFAVGMAGSRDLLAAREVAEFVGTDHHELVYTAADAIELVPQVISQLESFDPTLVHSAVPHRLVAELAAEQVGVVLAGEGADELFAGYTHFERHESGAELHEELVETLAGMHIGGLQRVDRVAGAYGIEPRMPFLDVDFVELAMALPPEWKMLRDARPAKWLLRRAFNGWLPDSVLWRRKEQFGQGTGMNVVLREHYEELCTDADLSREANQIDPPLRTREELAYYRIFAEALPGIDPERNVGRFAEA
ncbi:MAG: asparagine synthase-related protein [Leucobacter sp.]